MKANKFDNCPNCNEGMDVEYSPVYFPNLHWKQGSLQPKQKFTNEWLGFCANCGIEWIRRGIKRNKWTRMEANA